MARLLKHKDIPFIVDFLNHKDIRPHLSGVFLEREVQAQDIDLSCHDFYVSDDSMDLAIFDILDARLHVGHNAFRNKIKPALKNAKDILTLHFANNPLLDLIVGFTPINNPSTRLFNAKLGFKMIMPIFRADSTLCYRYELRRSDYETCNS